MTDTADFLRLREPVAAPGLDPSRPCWIFGAGSFGRSLASAMQARGIAVAGFVETTPRTGAALGLPVLDWRALAREAPQAQLALGIFNRDTPYDQLLALPAAAGFDPPLMPWTLYEPLAQALGWRFWLSPRALLLNGLERIAQVAQRLADAESVRTLYRICAFRLGLDMAYASFRSADRQYFNALTLPALHGRAITYVDCGAYDGDSFDDLLAQPGIACTQAFLLEPDPANYARLTQRVAAQAVCLPLAAAQAHGSLLFQTGQGEACTLVNGNPAAGGGMGASVTAVALDELLPGTHVHFIKFDIEGAEAQALRGAQQLIGRCRPVLAVSLYHNPQDIWELPELLFELCGEGYRFHIRQHGCNSFDSVLYAVPYQGFE
ncbi:FkbM family methyltransferase [Paracoccus sp. (in: a-proteobacteria)]|uniref:FkbM family methyltransferase n=1 Tax=Paracoccus sp. TaxID=267 RepID=UPI00321FE34E